MFSGYENNRLFVFFQQLSQKRRDTFVCRIVHGRRRDRNLQKVVGSQADTLREGFGLYLNP